MFYLVPLHDADEAKQRILGDLCLNADSLKVVVLFVLSEINQTVCVLLQSAPVVSVSSTVHVLCSNNSRSS